MSGEATFVLARHDAQSKLIAATREDGLGGRHLAMVNAKSLADTLGYRFGFAWGPTHDEEFHSVAKVDKIFSGRFYREALAGGKGRTIGVRRP